MGTRFILFICQDIFINAFFLKKSMNKLLLLFCFLLLTACTQTIPEETTSDFCGSSTYDSCTTDSDCTTGGCSGQICQSSSTEPSISTCEYQGCYNSELYSLSCACYEQKCSWE
ncbi:eight-cysteine-cluster domain-containing protein [Candidatus Woesearchaeota archaeon]|nr:eight-cysteine-cluster domain-containing protein [Candidatus Woesearchaeota archaeon]